MRHCLILLTFLIAACNPRQESLDHIITSYESYAYDRDDNNYWPDHSDSIINAEISALQKMVASLESFDASGLSTKDRINYDMLSLIIDDEMFNLQYGSHLMPLNAEGGFITGMIYRTQNQRLEDQESINRYRKTLQQIPAYIDQQIGLMRNGIEENKTLPQVVVDNCLIILNQQMDAEPGQHFLYAPLKELEKEQYDSLSQIIEENVLPAFNNLSNFLDTEYGNHIRSTVGVSQISEGKAYYEQRVRYFTTLDMTPEEVFEKGKAEVARIRSEMQAILDSLEFEGSFADFLEFLRTDPQFYADTPEELLHHAAWLSKKAEEMLPQYFGKLPRLPFTVNPVPAAIAPTYTGGRYSPGSLERHRAGQYWVNTYKLESRPLYVLPSLTLHEAVPGHHLQMALAQEIEEVPQFRRRTYLSAYGEGWGLYSEHLGKEAGIYQTPYEDFGRLTYEMWRACRLVVDPGMHYMGWTREQAVEYMASNTALSMHEVNTEIDRYIGWPGQAVSYKIGELKIKELRKMAEQELGDNFDIRSFHDKILENGSVPLRTLETIIKNYIQEEKNKETT